MRRCIAIFAGLCIISALLSLAEGGGSAAAQLDQYATDPLNATVKFFAQSPGRIGCGKDENLCIGSTHQKDFRRVLQN